MCCWRNILKIAGTWMEERIILCMDRLHKIHFVERRPLDGCTWSGGGIYMKTNNFSSKMMYGQTCGRICPMQRKRKQNMNGPSRNQSSTMEYTSSNQKIRSCRSEKVGSSDASSNSCKKPMKSSGETHCCVGKRNTGCACVVDADESTRPKARRSRTQTSSRSHH